MGSLIFLFLSVILFEVSVIFFLLLNLYSGQIKEILEKQSDEFAKKEHKQEFELKKQMIKKF